MKDKDVRNNTLQSSDCFATPPNGIVYIAKVIVWNHSLEWINEKLKKRIIERVSNIRLCNLICTKREREREIQQKRQLISIFYAAVQSI